MKYTAKFHNKGGYPGEREDSLGYLELDKVYEVDHVNVGTSMSKVTLKEVPGRSFNTALFDINFDFTDIHNKDYPILCGYRLRL